MIGSIISKIFFKITIIFPTPPDELQKLLCEFRKKSCRYCRLYPGVKKTLQILSKKYILSTASLAHASFAIPELENLGIKRYFKHLFFTSKLGYRKTSPQFFSSILKLSGARVKESVMIGDNLKEDIQGGKTAGMYTIWLKNPAMVNDDSQITADNILPIEYFNRLPELINKL